MKIKKCGVVVGPLVGLFVFLQSAVALAGALTCEEASAVVQLALRGHLVQHQLTPELVSRTVERFDFIVTRHEAFLTQPLIDEVKSLTQTLDPLAVGSGMLNSDCAFFQAKAEILMRGYAELRSTFTNADDLARELLQPSSATRSSDAVAPTFSELRLRLLQSLQVAVAKYSKETTPERAALYVSLQFLRDLKSYGKRLRSFSSETMAKAFALALDPHSAYMTPDESHAFEEMVGAGIDGIGVQLTPGPNGAVVEAVVPGGPADRSGLLHAGDVIVGINGRAFDVATKYNDAVKAIRGPRGTKVTLKIAKLVDRQLTDERVIKIKRGWISHAATGISSQLDTVGERLILTVRLEQFYHGSGSDLRDELVRQQAAAVSEKGRSIDAVVLDLRGNGGGSLDDAIQITGLFAKTSASAATRDRANNLQLLYPSPELHVYGGPLIVAIDQDSASASELVSGTFKDLERALIVGHGPSFGKGTMQISFPLNLNDGRTLGALKLTIGQFYTSGGASTQNSGVVPHFVVPGEGVEPGTTDEPEYEKDFKYALPSSRIQSLVPAAELAHGMRVGELVPALAAASQARMSGKSEQPHHEQLAEIHQIAAHYCDLLLGGPAGAP